MSLLGRPLRERSLLLRGAFRRWRGLAQHPLLLASPPPLQHLGMSAGRRVGRHRLHVSEVVRQLGELFAALFDVLRGQFDVAHHVRDL